MSKIAKNSFFTSFSAFSSVRPSTSLSRYKISYSTCASSFSLIILFFFSFFKWIFFAVADDNHFSSATAFWWDLVRERVFQRLRLLANCYSTILLFGEPFFYGYRAWCAVFQWWWNLNNRFSTVVEFNELFIKPHVNL